jgi:hypothetical protein
MSYFYKFYNEEKNKIVMIVKLLIVKNLLTYLFSK